MEEPILNANDDLCCFYCQHKRHVDYDGSRTQEGFEMMENAFRIQVVCHAGCRGEETPRSFTLNDRHVEVVNILDRWLAPDHRYFKVKGDDGSIYIIRNDVASGIWELTMFSKS